MAKYKAAVVGPIPLEDGRVVTAEQGPFALEVEHPHDQDLLARGVIIALEAPEAPAPSAPVQTPPAVGVTAGKAGA